MAFHQKLLTFGIAFFSALLLVASFSTAQAQPRYRDGAYSCQAQIHRAEARYDRAVRRYGRHSRIARERQRDLQHVRRRCARDDHRHSCRMQIDRAESRLHRAIRRYGRHSPEARERRRELRRVHDRCDRYYRPR